MVKFLATIVLFCSICNVGFGQQQTVFLSTASSVVPGATTIPWNIAGGTTSNMNYAGSNPSSHQVTIISADAAGHNCTSWYQAQIQGSVDNTNWVYLTQYTAFAAATGGGSTGDIMRVYQAYGTFPYLRVAWVNFLNPTNCVYSATYTGTIIGGTILELGSIADNVTTLKFLSGDLSSSGDQLIIGNGSNIGITVYTIGLCNDTASQTVIIKDTGGFVDPQPLFTSGNIPAGQCTYFGNGKTPLFTTVSNKSNTIKANLANATTVHINIVYRNE